MWNLKTNDTNELIYKTERDSQTWKTNMVARGKGWGGGIVRDFGWTYTHCYI